IAQRPANAPSTVGGRQRPAQNRTHTEHFRWHQHHPRDAQATEFPGQTLEPVRAHRLWMREQLSALLQEAEVPNAAAAAQRIQLIYDGALTASKLDRSTAPITLARQMVAELITGAQFAAS
ncbi:MAG: hypothetical protein P4L86_25945, partial [Mycobacterium sp.]|nr:hypothetical protein [Mycobacterium sp.]